MATGLDGGLDASGPADTEHSLIIGMDAVVMLQLISDPSVALVRALCVNSLYLLCQCLIFCCPPAHLSAGPLVVGCSGYMEYLAGLLYRIVRIPYCPVVAYSAA